MNFDFLDNFPIYEKEVFFRRYLRPCPFCKGSKLTEKAIYTEKYKPCTLFYIKCDNCGAQGPITKYIGDPTIGAKKQIEMSTLAKENWGIECTEEEYMDFCHYMRGKYHKY
jgi:hypothetical protein